MSLDFTNDRQLAYRRLSTLDSSRATNSPYTDTGFSKSRQTTPSYSQHSWTFSLSETLIFDHQSAYEDRLNVPFAPRPLPLPLPTPTPTPSAGTHKRESVMPSTGTFEHGARPESPQFSTLKEEQDTSDTGDQWMIRHIMAPSKTPKGTKPKRQVGRPRKDPATKTTGKTADDKSKKRPPPRSTPRASKIQKTEANSTKKLNNKAKT
jgi:hypothetical protein